MKIFLINSKKYKGKVALPLWELPKTYKVYVKMDSNEIKPYHCSEYIRKNDKLFRLCKDSTKINMDKPKEFSDWQIFLKYAKTLNIEGLAKSDRKLDLCLSYYRSMTRQDKDKLREHHEDIMAERDSWKLFKDEGIKISCALQSLELPGLITLHILDACSDDFAIIPVHKKWQLVTTVKHSTFAPSSVLIYATPCIRKNLLQEMDVHVGSSLWPQVQEALKAYEKQAKG